MNDMPLGSSETNPSVNPAGGIRVVLPPQKDTTGRTFLYLFLAMATGFLMPVCACICLVAVSILSFSSITQRFGRQTETGTAVGVIDLEGVIGTGDGFGATTGNLTRQLEWMADNSDVKALVIRANSPGGGVNGSDELWNAVREFRQNSGKPVVVYVHGTCASGCLYIASAADEIIASRNSLVGSIGVISTFFDASELLDEIGVEPQTIATGENKDFGSFFREITPEEREFWRGQLEIVLDNFIDVVATRPGSTLSHTQVRELATGQAWMASEALNFGLIDQIGYEQAALDEAAALAGIGDYRVQKYPFDFNLFDFFSGYTGGYFELPNTNDLLESLQQPPLQYRYFGPYDHIE